MRTPAVVLALGLLAACTSTRERLEPLPFHVALIPVVEVEVAPAEGDHGVRLRVAAERLTATVGEQLARDGFVRTTVLDLPADTTAEAFAALDRAEQDAHWVDAARRARADVLLEAELFCRPEVEHGVNSRVWADVPLFLVGGPLCWFVDDRSYAAQARLSARLYDLAPILDGRATLDDGVSRLVDVQARFAKAELDLLDRWAGNPGWLFASLVVPPAFLARGGDGVERALERAACEGLASALVEGVREEERSIREAERLVRFHLAEGAGAWREGDGVRVRAEVLLVEGGGERLDTWRLRCDAAEIGGEFGDGRLDPERATSRREVRVFALDARVTAAPDARFVQVELTDAGLRAARRTWTLPVREGAAPTPQSPVADSSLARAEP